jgi:hypothetical protein
VIDMLGRQTLGAVAMILLILGPVFSALWFLRRRKRMTRQRRRSPLTSDLLRSPGHALREKLEDMRTKIGMDTMLLIAVPMYPLAYFQVHFLVTDRLVSVRVVVVTLIAAAAFVVWQIRKLLAVSAEMDKLRLGLDAELAVGQELDQLMREGAVVFHDMPAERFNIDHVVIARQGVFAVETKGYSKPNRGGGTADATVAYDGKYLTLPDSSGRWAIDQAERQAHWLAGWLKASTGDAVQVTPVVALPGWFVKRTNRGTVLVFSGKELRSHLLKARTATPLSADVMQRVVHQVERQCRSVEPMYRPDDERAV